MKLQQVYQDLVVRISVEKLIEEPLNSEGMDRFEVRLDGQTVETVRELEANYFKRPDVPEEILIEDTRKAAFSIISPAFKEDNRWRQHDGNAQISALTQDQNFLKKVDTNQISFAKGDVLICEVKTTQARGVDGLKTEYIVERVLEHKPAARQLAMPLFVPDDEVGETDV